MSSGSLLRGILVGGGLLLAGPLARAGDLDGLLQNSPFGGAVDSGPKANASAEALELRGVFVDHGETFVSVFDNASHTGRWVGLNEEGNTFTVRSYDPAKGVARVFFQGRELTLTLKQARVVAAPAATPSPSAIPAAPPSAGSGQPAVAAAGPGSDEAVRLAAIAEEIRRRRALRQQGPTVVPPPGPSPKP